MKDPAKQAEKNRRDIIITSILLVIFAFTFTQNVLLRKKPETHVEKDAQEAQAMNEQLVLATNIRLYDRLRKERVELWDREWGRDPFVPTQVATGMVKAVNLVLNGILWDDLAPKAIVNEKTLSKGDTIYGYIVEEIRPRSVILRTGEKKIELRVFHEVFSEPRTST